MTQETIFACDALGDLYRYNEQLLWANKELLAQCDLLEAELATLVDAARPVVKAWKNKRAMLVRHGEMELNGECDDVCICASSMQLDALAALVGEEK